MSQHGSLPMRRQVLLQLCYDTGTATAPYQPQGQELAAPSTGQGSTRYDTGSCELDAAQAAFQDMVRRCP